MDNEAHHQRPTGQHDGRGALRRAVEAGDAPAALELLQSGTAPMVVDPSDGATALHLAAAAGSASVVDALIQAGCDVGMQDFVSCHSSGCVAIALSYRIARSLQRRRNMIPLISAPLPASFFPFSLADV